MTTVTVTASCPLDAVNGNDIEAAIRLLKQYASGTTADGTLHPWAHLRIVANALQAHLHARLAEREARA